MRAAVSGYRMRVPTSITTALIVLIATVAVRGSQGRAPAATATRASLPPIVQTCPMHPDVVEESPGTCPVCKMKLVPVRLQAVWSCPLHSAITRDAKGRCPVCGRELVQMTMALTWTCKGRADIDAIEPGRCPDGSPMIAKRTLRPHGNHNPQNGGEFFMAPDNQHHLEGTLPSTRLFRLYLYNEYARPLPQAELRGIRGYVEIKGQAIPLTMSRDGSYMDARVSAGALPANMTAKLQLKAGAPEYRFDFTFPSVTKDPGTTRPAATASRAIADQPSSIDPLAQVPIPSTVPEILAQLRIRSAQVPVLVARGELAAVFVPAFQARDLALALEQHLTTLPPAMRDVAGPAITRLVRAAWQVDAAGDLGNRAQVVTAQRELAAAAVDIDRAFASLRR